MATIPGLPDPSVARHRVLLIDDQRLIGETVRKMLADQADLAYEFCHDPASAPALADRFRPTVILQDLVMPNVDGLDMVRAFRAAPETAAVPIIVLSAKEEAVVKAQLFEAGANDYLVKLPDRIELVARIRVHSEAYERLIERNAAYAALEKSIADLAAEKEKSERLLLNILPAEIADRLKNGGGTIADHFDSVSVLFADLAGFTEYSQRADAGSLVAMLDEVFSAFDALALEHGVEKIKTIGDAYMAVAGLPARRPDHARAVALMALGMQEQMADLAARRPLALRLRIGIHSGPVVAGVIGKHKFSYDLWGDTVNTASRMESHGEVGRVHVAQSTRDLLADSFRFTERGEVTVKGKGTMRTYFLDGPA